MQNMGIVIISPPEPTLGEVFTAVQAFLVAFCEKVANRYIGEGRLLKSF